MYHVSKEQAHLETIRDFNIWRKIESTYLTAE